MRSLFVNIATSLAPVASKERLRRDNISQETYDRGYPSARPRDSPLRLRGPHPGPSRSSGADRRLATGRPQASRESKMLCGARVPGHRFVRGSDAMVRADAGEPAAPPLREIARKCAMFL